MSKTHWRRKSSSARTVSTRRNGYGDQAFDSPEDYASFKRQQADTKVLADMEVCVERGLQGAEGIGYRGTLAGWNTAVAALTAAKIMRAKLTSPDARSDADAMIRNLKSAMHRYHRDRYAAQLHDMTMLTNPRGRRNVPSSGASANYATQNPKHHRPSYSREMFAHHIQDVREAIAKKEWKFAADLVGEAAKYAKQGLPAKWAQRGAHEASELKRVIARHTRI